MFTNRVDLQLFTSHLNTSTHIQQYCYTHIHTHTHTHTHTQAHTHTHAHAHTRTRTHAHTLTHAHTRSHTHTFTFTFTFSHLADAFFQSDLHMCDLQCIHILHFTFTLMAHCTSGAIRGSVRSAERRVGK